jgi:FAD:protein FMN transferase
VLRIARMKRVTSRSRRWRGCVALVVLSVAACHRSPASNATPSAASSQAQAASSAADAPFVPQKVDYQNVAMGTDVHMIAFTSPKVGADATKAAIGAAFQKMLALAKLMSGWTKTGDVANINDHTGQFVKVSPDTFRVIKKSLWASKISGGVFDITFQAMSGLWRFGDAAEKHPHVPTPAEVAAKKKLIDYRKLRVNEADDSVMVPKGMSIGLGGIAKGYIVDRAADVLRAAGVENFLVQAGGDLLGWGHKPDGSPWVSGIQDPRGPHGTFFATIELSNHAFSTAGDYARAYIVDGKRYHHIIDPRTGYPATASRSVTLWAPDAFTADAIDDPVFILGPKKGLALVNSVPGCGAVIVDKNNKVWVSERLKGKVHILRQPTDGI